MHICHINLAKGFSGGEQQALNLILELEKQGIRQTLVCRTGGELERRGRSLGLTCHPVRHFLTGHLKRMDADLLHGHCGRSVYWAAIEHQLKGIPFLITRRVDNPMGKSWATRRAYGGAASIVCVSRAIERIVVDSMEVDSMELASTEVIPDSYSRFQVDDGETLAIKRAWAGKFLVGQIGKFLEHKGHHITVEAARRLQISHPHIQFLLLGDGPRRKELEAQALDLPNITFLGHRKDIGNYLSILDLLVFPSITEGLGSSILEAMLSEVPVIASETGGIPDLLEQDRNGILVPPGDADALTRSIVALAENPDLRHRLTAEASLRLPRFSPEAIAERYLSVYDKLTITHQA